MALGISFYLVHFDGKTDRHMSYFKVKANTQLKRSIREMSVSGNGEKAAFTQYNIQSIEFLKRNSFCFK